MDIVQLKLTLATFTDQPGSLLLERGNLVVQIGDELVSATTKVRDGQVVVIEDNVELTAERWLVHRIARLDVLADRLMNTFAPELSFVTPRGELIDDLEKAPTDDPVEVGDAVSAVQAFLDRRLAGTCSVLYLTSDAGEGKTTLINRLARSQAALFQTGKSDWLLVPINLGGRPFLRFDDIVAAALMNQLRFRNLYFEAFLQLVRLGYIVPALDGFEEVFVETAEGDAVSSLGSLISNMGGEGTLLIAARKAYFEFRALDRQAKLRDALPDADVAFGRIRLQRWAKDEFITYCKNQKVEDPESLYSDLVSRLTPDHPLLTRAVFVKRIAEIAKSADREKFLLEVRPETDDYFVLFIDKILERESTEKWINKQGDPPAPLLSVEEHHELLRLIAEEMWITKTGSLSLEMCSSLAELFCESKQMGPILLRQIRERVRHHALLISVGSLRDQVAFDHDNFREFFLGEQLGIYLAGSASADLRKMLRIDVIAAWTLDSAVSVAMRKTQSANALLRVTIETARSESPASFVRENSGAICVRLLEKTPQPTTSIKELTFPGDALKGRTIKKADFSECYFRTCTLDGARLEEVYFRTCEFEHLLMPESFHFDRVKFVDCRIHALTIKREHSDVDIYDPTKINRYCEMIGASIEGAESSSANTVEEILSTDVEVGLIRKLLLVFMRSTQVSDNVLTLRMGIHSHKFNSELMPVLKAEGILKEVKHTGRGYAHRFRLGVPVSLIEEALEASNGLYEKFLEFLKSHNT